MEELRCGAVVPERVANTWRELWFPWVPVWRVSRVWQRDGGARKGLGVSLSQDDRAGSPGRPRWTEFELQRGELHKGFYWRAGEPAGLLTGCSALGSHQSLLSLLSWVEDSLSAPGSSQWARHGPLAFSLVNLWLLLAGFWLTACGSRDSLLTQMVKSLPAMWETLVWSLGQEDPLEKEIAAHSSILAWKTPWMEEPGGLPSMGLQRVGHDWTTSPFHLSVRLASFPTYGCVFLFLEWLAGF